MILKPQDTLLILKYWSINSQGLHMSVREMADSIKVSIGEISKSTKRLMTAHLVVEREGKASTENSALKEWLCYGVRYAYPVENAGFGRGMPTAWNSPQLKTEIVPPDPPVVWGVSGGSVEGMMIKPFHESVPFAASNDETLYKALSLVEAIRLGKPRELAVARDQIATLLERQRTQ